MRVTHWLPSVMLISITTTAASGNYFDLKQNCNELKYFDSRDKFNFVDCETFCITHDCKRCRMICLHKSCKVLPSGGESRDCEFHEFLSTNCSNANMHSSNRIHPSEAVKKQVEESCAFRSGYHLSPPCTLHRRVKLTDKCRKEFLVSPWFIAMNGSGSADLSFVVRVHSTSEDRFEEKTKIRIKFSLSTSPMNIDLKLLDDNASFNAKTSTSGVHKFWIQILKLTHDHFQFSMGQGHVIGGQILFNMSTSSQLEEIVQMIAFGYSSTLFDWKFIKKV